MPDSITNLFRTVDSVHSYQTRAAESENLYIPKSLHSSVQKSISNKGAKIIIIIIIIIISIIISIIIIIMTNCVNSSSHPPQIKFLKQELNARRKTDLYIIGGKLILCDWAWNDICIYGIN